MSDKPFFHLTPRGWRWWHWFTPTGRAMQKWLRECERKIMESDVDVAGKARECFTNQLTFGVCDGSCGGIWHRPA